MIDKFGANIPGWRGKNLNRAGSALTKFVLTATVTYHLAVIPLPKWALKKMNRMARGFIWNVDDAKNASRGRSLVNW